MRRNAMTLTRRLVAMSSLVLVGLLAFAATTMAFDARGLTSVPIGAKGGGGGGPLPAAGNYTNSSVSASFFSCCGPDGSTQIQLFVGHNNFLSRPLGGSSNANATFAASFLSGGPIPISGANLFSFDQSIHAQGTPLKGCEPLGGKGAGP